MSRILALLCAAVVPVFAATYTEISDAGSFPYNAQLTIGSGPLSAIHGRISGGTDADMYLIRIARPDQFSASTLGSQLFDTQLFLFSTSGQGVIANDESGIVPGKSFIFPGTPFGPRIPGFYFIGITAFDRDPANEFGEIFPDIFGPGVVPAVNPLPIDRYSGTNFYTGSYSITLTASEFAIPMTSPFSLSSVTKSSGLAAVHSPEPSTIGLLGAALAGLALSVRRRGRGR